MRPTLFPAAALLASLIGPATLAQGVDAPQAPARIKYSMELTFRGLRAKDKAENGVGDSVKSFLLGGVFYQLYDGFSTKPNPDAYVIVTVNGGDTFLIPQPLRQIDDRTTLVNFTCPAEWRDKEVVVEVWRDNKESDAFWRTVVSMFSADVQATGGAAGLAFNAIPVQVSGTVRMKLEQDTFKNLTLVHDQLLATCKTKLPPESTKQFQTLTSSLALLGTTREVQLGVLTLQNHGLVTGSAPR